MKMHSYTSVNGYLQLISKESKEALLRLARATGRVGGWEKAIAAAKAHRSELEAAAQRTNSSSPIPYDSSAALNEVDRSYLDVSATSVLRQRSLSTHTKEVHLSRSVSPVPETPSMTKHVLVDHPDEEISKLAMEYSDLEYELTGTGPERVKWPKNITLKNFAVYQLIPTLVYELEFPRTDR
jgi:sterol O-acyltransferase